MNEPTTTSPATAGSDETLVFNPFDPAFRSDPYPFFSRLREEALLFDGPLGMPVLSRYADCVAMLRHPHASSDSRNSEMYEQFRAQQVTVDADEEMLGAMQTFLFMDPPDHTRLRALVAAEESGDRLTEHELLATCILLLVAGHETTVNLVGNGALALLRHPDQLEMLRADPPLIRTAIEEALRFDPPVQLTARTALQDIDLAAGRIRKGQ